MLGHAHRLPATFFLLFLASACDDTVVVLEDSGVPVGLDSGGDSADTNTSDVGDVALEPDSVDFGTTIPGVRLDGAFSLLNRGTGDLHATLSVNGGAAYFSVDQAQVTVPAGGSVEVTGHFVADTQGAYFGNVEIASDDPDQSVVNVDLTAAVGADEDHDGFAAGPDCDDADPTVNPGADETWYDGLDQDCDGASDYDQDRDGYDDAAYGGTDCNDADATISPAGIEVWYDGVDQDCDNRSDYDQDSDGYDAADYGGDDCDDLDPMANPGTLEVIGDGYDNDCDGAIDEALNTEDLDHDGYSEVAGDCNDGDATVNPAATEVWYDGLDQNCDGADDYDQDADGYESLDYGGDDCVDTDATINPSASQVWYDGTDADCSGGSDYDQDGDGYDDAAWGGTDCNDLDASINPGAADVAYDGVDQDCSGGSDYDFDGDGHDASLYGGDDCDDYDPGSFPGNAETWYNGVDNDCSGGSDYDQDGDGHDSADYAGDDCLDTDASVHPGATDTWYDGVDSDCAGNSDYDKDGDGYDSSAYGGTDCNDADPSMHPGAVDVWYDGIDTDCSGGSDYDQDGDGYLASAYGGTDCNDTNASIHPGAVEVWYDGTDQDCSGGSDYDQDGDTYTSSAYGGLDCNDTAAAIHPGATETCDSVDNDCDGSIDEGVMTTWYADADSDTYGNLSVTASACTAPAGYVALSTDCNDASAAIHPGAAEVCDSVDNDCDGSIDEGVGATYYADVDGDTYGNAASSMLACSLPAGYVTNATDCNDASAAIHPGATEVCDSVDNDCDGSIDEGVSTTYYQDADGDAYGNALVSSASCSAPSGYVADSTDCDDTDATVHPGATEVAYDGKDNDCDGRQDEMLAASESSWTVVGTTASQAIGTSGVWTYDDMNGDGDTELIIAAEGDDTRATNAGAIAFHDAGVMGSAVNFSSGYLRVGGTSASDAFGSAAVILGDVDGDGKTEIAVGAWKNDGEAADGGSIYMFDLYSGSTAYTGSQAVSTLQEGRVRGTRENGWLGYSLATGDLDGDGRTDLVAGSPGASSAAGRIYLFTADYYNDTGMNSSDADAYLYGVSSSDHLGYSVLVDDFDADGEADVVGCAPDYDPSSHTNAGACWFVTGADALTATGGGRITSYDSAEFDGAAASDEIGLTPQSIGSGDLDADGVPDLFLGLPGYDSATTNGGAVAAFSGGSFSGSYGTTTADLFITGDGALGTSVLASGDVDADGQVDLLTGAPTGGTSSVGVLYLYSGGLLSGTAAFPGDESASWAGATASDAFGTFTGGVTDLDGDGVDDLASAAPGYDPSSALAGAGLVYVLPTYP